MGEVMVVERGSGVEGGVLPPKGGTPGSRTPNTTLKERLVWVRNFRRLVAGRSGELVEAMGHVQRTAAEVLASEVIPLADACRFLEREAGRILAVKKLGRRGRPFWVGRVAVRVYREALGRVLVIGPANYPLFLPGVQMVQALVAGNSVVVKPGRGGGGVMRVMVRMLEEAGVPAGLVVVTGESVEEVERVVEGGVAKVFLTGGVEAGRAVLGMLAERCVQAVVELSGCDAAVVLRSADVGRAVKAIGYGTRLNGGETCIAPRRVFVAEGVWDQFLRCFQQTGERLPASPEATGVGSRGNCIVRFSEGVDVARLVNDCAYKLGATIFGEEGEARKLAGRLEVGMVVINDMIVPTADPRVSFGGRALSGFGMTRGTEGLLEMTGVKTVIVRRGEFLPHLEGAGVGDREMFESYLRGAHGGTIWERVRGVMRFLRLAVKRGKYEEEPLDLATQARRRKEASGKGEVFL